MANPLPAILDTLTDWAKMRPDIRGLALVGSHARNQASACSDIDLIFLTENPGAFRDAAWLTTIDWSRAALHPDRWTDEEYGIVWSRRVWLDPGHVIEFSFAPLLWADVSPVDSGTFRVISDGCQILYDPERLLTRLKNSVSGGPA